MSKPESDFDNDMHSIQAELSSISSTMTELHTRLEGLHKRLSEGHHAQLSIDLLGVLKNVEGAARKIQRLKN